MNRDESHAKQQIYIAEKKSNTRDMIIKHYFLPSRYNNVGEQVFLVWEIQHKEACGLARN